MKENRRSVGSVVLAIIIVCLPLAGGIVESILVGNQMSDFATMNKPPLAPPAWLFPVAWTILYLLMGIALLLMIRSHHEYKVGAICLFISQLMMNYMWTPIFFGMGQYWMALAILVLMWLTTIICAIIARKVDIRATWCLVPLILWQTFAAYLNAGIAVLN